MPNSSVRIFEPPDMEGVALVEARGIRQRLPRHAHARLIVGVITDGWRTLELPDRAIHIRKGEPFFIPPRVPHICAGGGDHGQSYLAAAVPPAMATSPCPLPDQPPAGDGLTRLFGQLLEAVRQNASLPRRQGLLRQLLQGIAPLQAPGTGPAEQHEDPVRMAREYLEKHWTDKISLDTLAAHAGASPFHLQRRFARATGMTPNEYLARIRVRHAAELLHKGENAVQTALACGFSDQSHFIRVFKRLVGVSPGRYRNQNPQGGRP